MNNVFVWLLSFVLPRRMWYRRFYLASRHWKQFSKAIRAERGCRCQSCGRAGYDVHHLTYKRLWRELARDVALLCRRCHGMEHERA